MPFDLMTAPATFQRAVDVILATVRFLCALTYLDDIVIYSPTFEQHLKDLAVVLRLLHEAGVSLKLQKCNFAAPKVPYLGFRVGTDGLELYESKTEAVRKAKPPANKAGLRRFLGMTGFYRRFIPNCARITVPTPNPQELTGKHHPWPSSLSEVP
jgi:Reverse transcriptase (RNA-dependent DNA polymerase)